MSHLLFLVTEDWYFRSHRLPLALAAKAAGYEVTIVTRVGAYGEELRHAGFRVIPFEITRGSVNPLRELATLWRLIRVYRRERPDIVHHVAMKPVLYGSLASRVAGRPHVVNALAGMGWLSSAETTARLSLRRLVRRVLARVLSTGIALVQNPEDGRELVAMGVSPDRVRRIAGAGVDLQRFQPRPEPAGTPVVVLPARLLWPKGVAEFVEAARILHGRGVDARFILAGIPDTANPSAVPSGRIAEWVAQGHVTHLGWVDDMASLLGDSHLVCLPSYYGEGIPKSLIEAAAAGRAIVTTDMPGCREVVRDGDNGLLVPARDANALAGALERLIADRSLRQQMGVRGRVRAEKEFGSEGVIRETLALYAEHRA
jgi:glycosyltransferase involved in cell wall biosynthesis